MPAGLLAAGASLLGNAINSVSTAVQNRKSRQWSEKMYGRQRTDNIDFWNMQNEYNSPVRQMERLKAAGLNPNLIYDQGAAAAAGQAGNVSTPDVQQAQFRSPEWGNALSNTMSTLGQYYDYEIKQAQTDNLRASNTVLLEEAALKNAQRANVQGQTDRTLFDLGLDTELRSVSADLRRENLRKLKQSTALDLRADQRAAAMNASNIREAAARVLQIEAQTANTRAEKGRIQSSIDNIRKDTQLKQLDIELRRAGINPSDPVWMRILGRVLNKALDRFDSPKSIMDYLRPSSGVSHKRGTSGGGSW